MYTFTQTACGCMKAESTMIDIVKSAAFEPEHDDVYGYPTKVVINDTGLPVDAGMIIYISNLQFR